MAMVARVIYKYTFDNPELGLNFPYIAAPEGKVVLVQQQGARMALPTIWLEHVMVNGAVRTDVIRHYHMVGDNQVVDEDSWTFEGSAICGAYVWHIYSSVPKAS